MIHDKAELTVQLKQSKNRTPTQCNSPFEMFNLIASVLILCTLPVQVILAQSTCSINGVTFQAGEPLGETFISRCGSSSDFPCFCQPDLPTQIDCPLCGIATQDNEEGLVCALIDGPLVNVTSLDGEAKECLCRRDLNGNPETICFLQGSTLEDASTSTPLNDDVCTLEWADGSVDVFQDGQSYGELFIEPCRNPSEYPCFCNVSIPEKRSCPYCAVTTNTGDIACGRIGETFVLVDENQEEISCDCQEDLEAVCSPASTAGTPAPQPTFVPAFVPNETPMPTAAVTDPTMSPFFVPFPTVVATTSEPTLVPTIQETSTRRPSGPLPTLDKPSILLPTRTPPISLPVPGCTYVNESTGEQGFAATGATLDFIKGPCAPNGVFPALCNPALPGGVEYPYCVFTMDGQWGDNLSDGAAQQARTSDELVTCASNGDQATVPTAQGTVETCSCIYLNPFIGAVSSCPDMLVTIPLALSMSSSPAPVTAPSLPVSIEDGSTLAPIPPTVAGGSSAFQRQRGSRITTLLAFFSISILLATQL